jgi:hypothetical protein
MIDSICLTCASPLDKQSLMDSGVSECLKCGDRFLHVDDALAYLDEIPHDEYLGG